MLTRQKLYGKSRTVPILKTNLQILSWLIRGSVRKFVFSEIEKRITPSELVEKLAGSERRRSESHYVQVSRALAELEAQKLVKCLNPKEKTGRFYELTKRGKNIKKELE